MFVESYLFYIGAIAIICILLHIKLCLQYEIFKKLEIPYIWPKYFYSNIGTVFWKRYSSYDYIKALYNRFPSDKLFGLIEFQQAVLFIREPEIIYRILVKDFAKFADHSSFIDEKTDILFGSCLLMLKGKKWHDMRSTLSPTFTASKMRTMFDMMLDCANVTTNHILKQTENGNTANWEMKEFFMRYGNDVMCSCLYGVTVDSMKKADNSNSFLTNGRNVLKFNSTKVVIRTALIKMWPKLMKSLGIAVMENSCLNFFRTTVLDSIRVREENDIYRPDMINILQKVKREQSKNILSEEHKETTVLKSEWSDDEIMAQVFIFYFAGFDSSSNILMFLAYELALNPDVQDTLYNEIRKFHENSGGKNITYDTIGSMKYLDQSIKETLRKWPAVTLTDRCCLHDFEVDIGKEKPLIIKKDSVLWIPMYALHHDPQYYPEPEKFDPSRFSDENKGNIVPGTFLGFGIGPRSCIGLRFAYIQMKIIVYNLVLRFRFETTKKTQIPVKMSKIPIGISTEKGIHLAMRRRDEIIKF